MLVTGSVGVAPVVEGGSVEGRDDVVVGIGVDTVVVAGVVAGAVELLAIVAGS